MNAVHAAIEHRAVARAPRFVSAEDVRDIVELPRLAPQLTFPEARHLAGCNHRLEVDAIGIHVELEDAIVVDAHHPCARSENLFLSFPVDGLAGLEADGFVHGRDDGIEVFHNFFSASVTISISSSVL